jgi:hypothetical protein
MFVAGSVGDGKVVEGLLVGISLIYGGVDGVCNEDGIGGDVGEDGARG